MNQNLEARLRPADIAWLAAAAGMLMLFVGAIFMLLFGQTVLARADEAGAIAGIERSLPDVVKPTAFPPT